MPSRAHDSRPIAVGSPDGFALLLDRLDRIDDRLRDVEETCGRIEEQQQAAKSRISLETKRQDDEDKSIDDRVRKLETEAAESKGSSKTLRIVLAIAAMLGGGTAGAGTSKAIDAIAESGSR